MSVARRCGCQAAVRKPIVRCPLSVVAPPVASTIQPALPSRLPWAKELWLPQMRRALQFFAFFTSSAFALGSVGYLALHMVLPQGYVFGGRYRMFLYHETHPLQYIAVVAVTYGSIATACVLRWSHLEGWHRFSAIVGIMIATVFVASAPGGVLWKIHDMQAGFFTMGARFWSDLLWGALTGLEVGWLVIALSFPYNIIGLIVGYTVTLFGYRIGAPAAQPFPPRSLHQLT